MTTEINLVFYKVLRSAGSEWTTTLELAIAAGDQIQDLYVARESLQALERDGFVVAG